MSLKALLIATGYIRFIICTIYIIRDISNIIAKYFEIIENFAYCDADLIHAYCDEGIEYQDTVRTRRDWFKHKTGFGGISIPINGRFSREMTIKWRIEFSMYKNVPIPYFVGFTNHTSCINRAPHKADVPRHKSCGYFGYAMCFYQKLWCKKYFSVKGHQDDQSVYDRVEDEIESTESPA